VPEQAGTGSRASSTADRPLGLIACSALVIGNVIGSGFFLSPAALAPYGVAALVGWVLLGAVAICLALLFARLAQLLPGAGGPYAFARKAFGPFAGYLVAWSYWVSMWVSQPAIALTFAGYLGVFYPPVAENHYLATGAALAAMWTVGLVNMHSVRSAGIFQSVAVGLKLIPFAALGTVGLFWVHPQNFVITSGMGHGHFLAALLSSLPLIMFAFLGIESSTVPADHVADPEKTIPRATLLGTLVCVFIFLFCTIAVMGAIPPGQLAHSHAPFADAAEAMWGHWASTIVAAAVIISSLGGLNGWTLLMGQVPMAAARDGLFPEHFGRLNAAGVPAFGIIISLALGSTILVMQATGVNVLVGLYSALINLSTTAEMIPYVFCALAEGLLIAAFAAQRPEIRRIFTPISLVSFIFSLLTICGAGADAGLWTLVLVLLGLPFYALILARGAKPLEED
jgi:basic amino acid/polyamine antiporter, APA family